MHFLIYSIIAFSISFSSLQAEHYSKKFSIILEKAKQGDYKAQDELALMYYHGQGTTQNYKEAVKWFKVAAQQGYAMAQNNLALMYYNGEGIIQDEKMAHMWFNIATTNGDKAARKVRDMINETLSKKEIEEAQEMARQCVLKKYKNC